jgi:EAL domain-containing protein (putative c-di-GMP-specific phosphodiesterase class I)/ActR/RegA family two-component response regulator
MDTTQRVLIIDGDPSSCSRLGDALRTRGRHVIACRDLESAHMVIERYPLTHILTDITFTRPFRYEGLELLDWIKQAAPTTSVIVVTDAREDLRLEALARGADVVLQKPFSADQIRRLVEFPSETSSNAVVTFVPTLDDILGSDLLKTKFQPMVWTEDPKYAVGFEALTRLKTDSLLADPELLFRYAQQKGRVVDLEMAAAACSIASGSPLARLGILSLNIHPEVFAHADRFTDVIMDSAADAQVSPHRLVLEITEQGPLPDLGAVEAVSTMMRRHGIKFAFDDVGIAYSHLRAIAAVRPSYLKISQHFGTSLEANPFNRKIVENVEALARSFSSEVVLEGIETKQTDEFARQTGITFGQGYYYSRPADAEVLLERYQLRA